MIPIDKRPEPRWLAEYRADPHATFASLSGRDKQRLRAALVAEQRGLCAYCMRVIKVDQASTTIEHWVAQSTDPSLDLAYGNLLAVCDGGRGQPPTQQHCDTLRGNKLLTFHPARLKSPSEFRYLPGGRIETRTGSQSELDDVLGLNIDKMVTRRKQAVSGYAAALTRRRSGPLSKRALERARQKLLSTPAAKPYLGALLYWLEKAERKAR